MADCPNECSSFDAMVCDGPRTPLAWRQQPCPTMGSGDVRIAVHACGVCRTDVHLVDGELPMASYPRIPGHEVVGTVLAAGSEVTTFASGERVGVPWLGGTCGTCFACHQGQENLCQRAVFTGCQRDGGFATETVADARYCVPIPDSYESVQAAPLLCAGLIGYRAWSMVSWAQRVGFFGFGAAAHLLTQVARHCGREVFAFTRPGDRAAQALALRSGAVWSGDSTLAPPVMLDGAIIFAPVGNLVPLALKAIRPGGTVVCAGIHMSPIPSFPYALLWGEKQLRSVANLTRADAAEFFAFAADVPLRAETHTYSLRDAERAINDLRAGVLSGVAVLDMRTYKKCKRRP